MKLPTRQKNFSIRCLQRKPGASNECSFYDTDREQPGLGCSSHPLLEGGPNYLQVPGDGGNDPQFVGVEHLLEAAMNLNEHQSPD